MPARTLALALLIDLLLGDPPNRYHPVAWMGRWIARVRPRQVRGPTHGLLRGAAVLLSGAALSALAGYFWARATRQLPSPLRWLLVAAAWKSTFAIRSLFRAADAVRQALERGDLPQARRLVGWHLVSRNTSTLTPAQVAAATIESVAENASDGIVAPILYGVVGGLPAALVYRFVNTADAMLGYRGGEYEWLGKVPARADDALNFLPARFTAMLIVAGAGLIGEDPQAAWQTLRRDARRTASPNAGYPMSAMAGALRVSLEKPGHYCLGEGYPSPQPEDISRSLRVLRAALLVGGLLYLAARGVRAALAEGKTLPRNHEQ